MKKLYESATITILDVYLDCILASYQEKGTGDLIEYLE